MCGFAALIAFRGTAPDPAVVRRMTDMLQHRGPDDSGYAVDERVGLGFRRLAILDLSAAGHQPFESDDAAQVMVFNGEIFNYIELRQQLEGFGHRFRSSGDTEVLLAAYRQWGHACVERFNGMWAFLIYDRRKGVVFGSRDRFGVKPLYRARAGNALLFASEIKALRASGLYAATPRLDLVGELLCRGTHGVPGREEETFYVGVEQVPAGSAFEVALDGSERSWRFWNIADLPRDPVADPAGAFAELFEDAVRLRMRSDVPVGVSLSGGLDSTAIITAMARQRAAAGVDVGEALHAFSYVAPEFDESEYIDLTVRQTGATRHDVGFDEGRLWDRLGDALWYHDEPLQSATALISFEIYRMAAAHGVRVVLCGQGADETLAGYPDYFPEYWGTLLRGGAPARAWREVRDHHAVHGGDAWRTFRGVVARSAKLELGRSATYRRLARERRTRHERQAHPWFAADVVRGLGEIELYHGAPGLDSALRLSVERAPLPLYLRVEDRNSMAHSVEARLPFMDYRLVALAFRLAPEWKMRGPWNKYVLREAMRGRMPERVRARVDKMGFPTAVARWFRTSLYEPMQDTLASAAVAQRGLYDVARVRSDLERHRRGEIDVSRPLFHLAQVERWLGTLSGDADASRAAARGPVLSAR